MGKKPGTENRYAALLTRVFQNNYSSGAIEVAFARQEIDSAAKELKIVLPKNIGDIIYSFRYRVPLPALISATTGSSDIEWIIEPAGRAKYLFKQVRISQIIPNPDLVTIKIPDATPEIVLHYAQGDEQALLAKVRYNRLIDIFLGLTTYSLQNHLRTSVRAVGQIEIDELYVGLDRNGCHYIIPVQAKGGKDRISVLQTKQDLACCSEKFPAIKCRAISTQFMMDNRIAMFEFTIQDDQVKIVDEKHYKLLSANEITSADIASYRAKFNHE